MNTYCRYTNTIIITILLQLVGHFLIAQEMNAARWNISSKKVDEKTYELHIIAKIDRPWHIYSQQINGDLGFATRISLTKNPLIIVDAKPKEIGQQLSMIDPKTGAALNYYNGIVEFVQTVTLSKPAKTRLNGSIEYILCTDERCLPPAVKKFSVLVGE
jgi:hypothetical protein